MIINIQAFNATGKDARRIYDVLDDFQSRKPIDVIARTGRSSSSTSRRRSRVTRRSPPSRWRPSASSTPCSRCATQRPTRPSAPRCIASTRIDAYNQKLVKKIAVRGITVKHLAGSTAYLYVDGLEIGKGAGLPEGPRRAGGADRPRASGGRSSG
jgi:type III restriction enzyme